MEDVDVGVGAVVREPVGGPEGKEKLRHGRGGWPRAPCPVCAVNQDRTASNKLMTLETGNV